MSEAISAKINYEDFIKVDIRTGTIVQVDAFPEARKPAYKLLIDFGDIIGLKKSSAQITELYPDKSALIGTQVLAVINFPEKQIGPFKSEVLTLGVPDERGKVILITPNEKSPNGSRLF